MDGTIPIPRMRLAAAVIALTAALSGCKSVSDVYQGWFGSKPAQQPAPLVSFQTKANASIAWQTNLGGKEATSVFYPTVSGSTVYAAGAAGQIRGYGVNGAQQVSIDAGTPLSGGIGVVGRLLLVGTARGEVRAYESSGKLAWRTQLGGEVLSAPTGGDDVVVVKTADGRVHGLNAADGKLRWLYSRPLPSLAVRSYAPPVVSRGAVFAGFPGGRLVAIGLSNGTVGWESVVSIPRGATELERVSDVTSAPVIDREQVCAAAYQGRVACFDIVRGQTLWARDVSSVSGMGLDSRGAYVSDEKGAVIAYDPRSGSSQWKQEALVRRWPTAPLPLGRYVIVGDVEGYVHILSRDDGSFAARVATDGSAIQAPPVALDFSTVLVQTRNGGLFAISIR